MRWVVALCLVAGCGRLGFDAVTGDDVPATCDAAPEPNDSIATATPLELGRETGGRLCKGDVDVFAIELAQAEEVAVTITSEGPGWPSIELVSNDGARAPKTYASRLTGFADRTGTFYVRVAGVAPVDGTPYRLTVTKLTGRHIFIAPTGNDAGPGTFDVPLQTFDAAFGRAMPGDTLVLRDGDYTVANNNRIWATCNVDAMSGTQDAPIRLVAFTERRAFMLGDGNEDAIRFDGGCAYWSIEGLRVENQDRVGGTSGGAITFNNTSHMTIRRVLARKNNRFINSHVITIADSSDILVEDSEIYDFHRNGLLFYNTQRATARRIYIGSRGSTDVSGGYVSDPADKGDTGVAVSHSRDALVENVISEGNGAQSNVSGYDIDTTDARWLGDVALDNDYGFISSILTGGAQNTVRTRYENCVSVGSASVGFYIRSNMDTSCTACTAIGSATHGWDADLLSAQPRTASSHCINCLAIGSGMNGFYVQQQTGGWSLESANAFNNGAPFDPPTAPELTAPMQLDPKLGGCLVYEPVNAPLRGAGVGGGTIGAEVIYRYVDGIRTTAPLWDPETGAFPCGAIVEGVNDSAAGSCIGVHNRLHVGAPDCPLPYPAL
ncbi:MAG TPA: right-handed parallel beta-helix repeat-containing protein [Kofleriaceae bacterium]|nr:right-handed parallel beta-helix repeat-containing protein [Kofleriaceae bacterium]